MTKKLKRKYNKSEKNLLLSQKPKMKTTIVVEMEEDGANEIISGLRKIFKKQKRYPSGYLLLLAAKECLKLYSTK
jgi:hypothetical protein